MFDISCKCNVEFEHVQTFCNIFFEEVIHTMDGDILKRLISKSGKTQAEFAESLGASRGTVIRLTQMAEISEDWKEKICQVIGVDASVFERKKPLSEDERQALWDIINAQKEIIAHLQKGNKQE